MDGRQRRSLSGVLSGRQSRRSPNRFNYLSPEPSTSVNSGSIYIAGAADDTQPERCTNCRRRRDETERKQDERLRTFG